MQVDKWKAAAGAMGTAMHVDKWKAAAGAMGMAGLIATGIGFWASSVPAIVGGIIGLASAGAMSVHRIRPRRRRNNLQDGPVEEAQPDMVRITSQADPDDTETLARQMLGQGRYALLLRPQIAEGLDDRQLDRAVEALKAGMALVPDGHVIVGQADSECDDDEELTEAQTLQRQGRIVQVAHFFLDRYPVTNREYYEFVAAGGYGQLSLWDESIWTAVLDFVDSTGEPGPRFWVNGCLPPGKENHPVVGVSWHEAVAYARWAGKRLPTDAEWVKAGSWPIDVSDTNRIQRKYPWGDTMDRDRVNLWGSGPGDTIPVDESPNSVSVGGVYQLIGNVWEWTRGNFLPVDYLGGELALDTPMKSIRGGAFNSYFDNQVTCQFQSGEPAISRKRNIGFRCAVGTCDLMLARPEVPAEEPESVPIEEVPV
jgi:formylglycine-generating enzyme required for sulfatase activity